LLAAPKAKGARGGGKKDSPRGILRVPRDTTPTLADLAGSKNRGPRTSVPTSGTPWQAHDRPARAIRRRGGHTQIQPRLATRQQVLHMLRPQR
jgi:hypothetical protein